MSSDENKIDLYLIHATVDPNSGSQIGFPPTIQGLPHDATISNLIALLNNLHAMGQVGDVLAPAAVARMQFWGIDGTNLARTQSLCGLPEPRVVLLVTWATNPAPVLPTEQSRTLAKSFFNYARENDGNFTKFFGDQDLQAVQEGTVEEDMCEVTVRFSFLADKIDVHVARAGQTHLSFQAEMAPAQQITGYCFETTFSAASVPPMHELPPQLVQIAVTLVERLGQLESLELEAARPIVNQTNQALSDNYIKAANYCPVDSRFLKVQ